MPVYNDETLLEGLRVIKSNTPGKVGQNFLQQAIDKIKAKYPTEEEIVNKATDMANEKLEEGKHEIIMLTTTQLRELITFIRQKV